ncbi:MAG: hypothetical protein HYU55_08495, partial [Nocardioides sp.]|nr:hypothetical protein [Nocardioides sp.]
MRWLAALGLLLAGAVTGVAVVALHPIGWGLALGLVATGAVVAALRALREAGDTTAFEGMD